MQKNWPRSWKMEKYGINYYPTNFFINSCKKLTHESLTSQVEGWCPDSSDFFPRVSTNFHKIFITRKQSNNKNRNRKWFNMKGLYFSLAKNLPPLRNQRSISHDNFTVGRHTFAFSVSLHWAKRKRDQSPDLHGIRDSYNNFTISDKII